MSRWMWLILCLLAMLTSLTLLYVRSFHLDFRTPAKQGSLVLYGVDVLPARSSPPAMPSIRVLITPHRSLKIPWNVHPPTSMVPIYARLRASVRLPDGREYWLSLAPSYRPRQLTRLQRWWLSLMSSVGLYSPPTITPLEALIPIAYPEGVRWLEVRVYDPHDGKRMARWRLLNPPTPPHNLSPTVRFQQNYAAEGIRIHLDVYYDRMRSTPLSAHDPAVPWGQFLLRWTVHYRRPPGGEYRLIAKNIRVLAEWGYALEYYSWGVKLSSNRGKALEETVLDNFMDFPFSAYQRVVRVEADLEQLVYKQHLLHLRRIPLRSFTTARGEKLLVASPSEPVEVGRIDGRAVVLLPVDPFYQQFLHETPPPAKGKVKVVGFLKGIPSADIRGFEATLRKEPLRCWLTLWRYNWQDFHLLAVDFPPGRHLSTGDLNVLVQQIKIAGTDRVTLTAPVLPWRQPQPEISLFGSLD